MNLIRKKTKNEKIEKSKEIIKKEKKKIKEERQKQKEEKKEKFYQTKIGEFIKKFSKNKKKKENNDQISLKEQIFSMIYFEIIGAILCLLILFALSGGRNYIKLYMELDKLINVYDTLKSNYYGNLDNDKLIDNAIESMINSIGDGYTTYTNEADSETFLENLEGTYEGIGCMVSMNEIAEIIVISVFEDGPSDKAGLQAGDIILAVDNKDYTTKTSEDVANYIKGNNNQKITMKIRRNDIEKELTITRKQVEIPSVTSTIMEEEGKKIGYIDISVFSSVTYKQFKDQLEDLEKENIEGLIIDVRNDTGGYLSAVTNISSLFLKKGKVIYQLEDEEKTEKIKDETKEYREYPIAVLINQASASASEILASAIKESYNGYVIGTNSYGKGTVQKTKRLSDGSMIKYTIQNWLTPDGLWIHNKGVEPTHKVELNLENNTDNQLYTAIEVIIKDLK